MTKKDCFIISEPNNDVNVETTPNMLSRDGANIIDKNSSSLVKCNSSSHVFINIESIYLITTSTNDLIRINGKSKNNGDIRMDLNDKDRKESEEKNDSMTNQLKAEINKKSNAKYNLAVSIIVIKEYTNDLSTKCDKVNN